MIEFSKRVILSAAAASLMALALTGCGGDVKDGAATTPPASTTATVGVDGGTVNGPDGVQVVIPAGALSKATEVGISNDGSAATEIGGIKPISKVIAVTPHGTEFAESVRINLPFNPADVGAGGQPVIIKSQPGGTWTALQSEVVGSMVSADISGFSYYAVGTCYTSRDTTVGGPDPLIACPTAHSLKLELLDNSGVALPVLRNSNGVAIPVLTITEPTQLKFAVKYSRPPSGRLDHISVVAPGVRSLGWPVNSSFGGPTYPPDLASYQTDLTFDANPSAIVDASRPGGKVIRFEAYVTTQMDAFYLGCLCFKPASWTYVAEVPVRVIYTAPATPPPPPVATYTVGGTVSGLTGTGLVLRNNGAGNLAVAANATAFAFAAPVNAGSAYNVTVLSQPAGQTCSVSDGAGIANAAVSNVAVSCVTGTVAKGWQGAGLLETLDAGDAVVPQVVFDANGNGMAIWTQSDGTYFRIQSRRYTFSSGWGPITPVGTGGAVGAINPRIAADGLGNLMAVWTQPSGTGTTTSIWTNRYQPASGWGTAALLENNLSSVGGNSPEIAVDPAGNAMVVWYEFDGSWTNLWARRYAASGAWGAATLIENDNAGGAAGHRVVMDAGGNAMVVWVQTDSIRFNRYVVGSGWGTATRIQGSNLSARNLDIALDSAGSMLMAWAQHDGTTDSIYSSRLQSGTGLGWSTATLVETSTDGASQLSVGMAGNGNAIVLWMEETPVDGIPSIWARPYVAGVGGTAVRIDDSTPYSTGGYPQIAMDAAGNAMAVWSQGLFTWANRYVAGSGWAGATLIDSAAVGGGSMESQVAVDANGNAIAVWPHSGVSGANIWANVFR